MTGHVLVPRGLGTLTHDELSVCSWRLNDMILDAVRRAECRVSTFCRKMPCQASHFELCRSDLMPWWRGYSSQSHTGCRWWLSADPGWLARPLPPPFRPRCVCFRCVCSCLAIHQQNMRHSQRGGFRRGQNSLSGHLTWITAALPTKMVMGVAVNGAESEPNKKQARVRHKVDGVAAKPRQGCF